jgi:hypothetical protein
MSQTTAAHQKKPVAKLGYGPENIQDLQLWNQQAARDFGIKRRESGVA